METRRVIYDSEKREYILDAIDTYLNEIKNNERDYILLGKY